MGRKPVPRETITLRVSPEEFVALSAAAGDDHSVQEEARRRLAEYRSDSFDRAIGDLAAIVANRSQQAPAFYAAPPEGQVDTRMLGIVRDALASLLTKLGAIDSSDLGPIAEAIAFDIAARIKTPTPDLARISRALGFKETPNG